MPYLDRGDYDICLMLFAFFTGTPDRSISGDVVSCGSEAIAADKKALETPTDREFSYDGDPVTISRERLEECLRTPYKIADIE